VIFGALGLVAAAVVTTWPMIAESWAISRRVRKLRDSDPAVRKKAADDLEKFGASAVSWLLPGLGHGDAEVRRQSYAILSRIWPSSVASVGAYLKALDDPDAQVRGQAARTVLGKAEALRLAQGAGETTGERLCERAVEALCKALHDPSPVVRIAAAGALGHGAGWDRWAVLNSGKATGERLRARAIQALCEALQDPFWEVRRDVAGQLGHAAGGLELPEMMYSRRTPRKGELERRSYADEAVQALCGALHDHDWQVRCAAADALARLGAHAGSAVTELEGLTHDRDPRVLLAGTIALASVAPQHPRALVGLRQIISDPALDVQEKRFAVYALKNEYGERAVDDTLLALLTNENSRVRFDAIQCLHDASSAESIRKAVRKRLRDSDPKVAAEAAVYTTRHSPGPDPEVRGTLIAGTRIPTNDEEDRNLLSRVSLALRHYLSEDDEEIRSIFIDLLDRLDRPHRVDLMEFLGHRGPSSSPFLDKLVELSSSSDPVIAECALTAIGKIAPKVLGKIEGWSDRDDPPEDTR
jgi:HEAT repeat protein